VYLRNKLSSLSFIFVFVLYCIAAVDMTAANPAWGETEVGELGQRPLTRGGELTTGLRPFPFFKTSARCESDVMNNFLGRKYDLMFEKRGEYLYAHISAAVMDRQGSLDCLCDIMLKFAESKRKLLLIERDIPAAGDPHLFAAVAHAVRLSRRVKIAFMDRNVAKSEAGRYAIASADARNADYKFFTDLADAEIWLQRESH
jgi:hypothetical protein